MANIHLHGPYRKAPLTVKIVRGAATALVVAAGATFVVGVPAALLYLAVRIVRAAWGG